MTIVPIETGGMTRLPVTYTTTGLVIPPGGLSADEYLQLGEELRGVQDAAAWWWGDYLNAFQRDWGEMYTQALEEGDYAYQTLRIAKYVCGKFALFRRRNTLGFSFHAEVAALDDGEQDRLLDRAIAEGWTRQTLRLAVRQERDPYAQPLENHQLINQSDNDRWFTPAPFLDAAHELMGGIDLDPASEEFANRIVRAARFFTEDDDGLARPWAGRVWLNPPYGLRDGESNQARWSRALIERHAAGDVTEALLLVNAVTGNQWFAPLKRYPICFPDNRIRFYNEETEAGQPTHSNAIVYFGPAIDRFAAIFGRFGAVLATREVWDGAR